MTSIAVRLDGDYKHFKLSSQSAPLVINKQQVLYRSGFVRA